MHTKLCTTRSNLVFFNYARILNYFAKKTINQISSSKKVFVLILKGHRYMGEKGQANYNYGTIIMFHKTILLMC